MTDNLFRHKEIYVSSRMVKAMKLHMCIGTDLWMAKDVIQRILQYVKDNPREVEEPQGTYECPICGCATPHAHSQEQIDEWRNLPAPESHKESNDE